MKKYIVIKSSWFKNLFGFLSWIWIFTVPYQFFLTDGISYSGSLIIFFIILFLLFIYLFLFPGKKSVIISFYRKNRFLMSIFILILMSSILSTIAYGQEYLDIKELLRWVLFIAEFFIAWVLLKLKLSNLSRYVSALIVSAIYMSLLSLYQLFVPLDYELNVVTKTLGALFNDPELVIQKFMGIGKFNWEYGEIIRIHGVFANVSHFSFYISAVILIMHFFKDRILSKVSVKTFNALFLFFMVINVLTLVRATFIAFLVISVIDLILWLKNKNHDIYFLKGFFVAICISLFVGLITPDSQIFFGLLGRFLDMITFDGYFFPALQDFFVSVFPTSERIIGFDDYGGVGGRVFILKETVFKILIPNILDVYRMLFGWGPGSFSQLFGKVVSDPYFSAFGSPDISYLLWLVELGFAPFIYVLWYVVKNIGKLKMEFLYYWREIIFILIVFSFMSTVPDIRLSMLFAVLINIYMYSRHG